MAQQVFISAHLAKVPYGESVYRDLTQKLAGRIHEISSHSNNIWCRDYMPIQSASGKLVHFEYTPSYMTNSAKWDARRPCRENLQHELRLECTNSDIIMDGGAIEIHGSKAIMSDRVFRDNSAPEEKIVAEIKYLLDLKQLFIVPQHPFDFTGHVDGTVRFIDDKRVAISEMLVDGKHKESEYETNVYRKKLIDNWDYSFKYSLMNAGLELVELPCTAHRNQTDKTAHGIYLNFLKLDDLIIMPSYNQPEDREAKQKLETLYRRNVKMVDASELSAEGGMINCVTWSN